MFSTRKDRIALSLWRGLRRKKHGIPLHLVSSGWWDIQKAKLEITKQGDKEDTHVGEGRDELPAHCRALCEHLWLWYLGSALKVFWNLPILPEELPCFVHIEA